MYYMCTQPYLSINDIFIRNYRKGKHGGYLPTWLAININNLKVDL